MSVVYKEESFAILDEQLFYRGVYANLKMTVDPALYDIHNPYMMDSEFEAWKNRGKEKKEGKRKRKLDETHGKTGDFDELFATVKQMHSRIQSVGRQLGHFAEVEQQDNNLNARAVAKRILYEFPKLFNAEAMPSTQILTLQHEVTFDVTSEFSVLNSWYTNEKNHAIEINLKTTESNIASERKIYLPARSTFHIGNVTDVEQFCRINDCTFDLIIADPPWYNRSVKRNETYEMDETILKGLSMEMLSDWGILAIWISNATGLKPKLEKYLRRWNVQIIAEWAWLKLTREGEPVCEFKSQHKLPYEVLLLCSRTQYQSLPQQFVFAGIPMGLHSRKPPLIELLNSLGFSPKSTLELFARSLLPDTTSIGFEPLLCQSNLSFVPSLTADT